ncbi:cache domain-containing protein [Pseudogemmobacter faecipullorum]|uniref:histidine kinase n=1 Tax=Pseudogemmobacter faecipullorum TaxID=2755041 RepID=A0ABS8CK46_9RHOB|nr:cache domain-containing protein [Pseudogemmobacter faecipullorum]MCB5409543.1 PAS domain S-box protein [Pseudogemmobacter faecipullorum]
MRLSLRLILACGLAGLQFLAVMAVVFSSYFSSERALIDHARDLLRDVGTHAIAHSKGFLSPAEGAAVLAARLAQNRVVASDDQFQLEQLLFQQLQIAPQFSGLYYGSEEGNFVFVMRSPGEAAPFRTKLISHSNGRREVRLIWRDNNFNEIARKVTPEDPYDPRERAWYQGARNEGRTIWADPYIFFSSQQPGITLSAPVKNGPEGIRGVVGVDIEIASISDFLANLKIGTHGKALIINQNGDVIAHPDKSLIRVSREDGTLRFPTIAEFEDPIARAAFAHLANGETGVEKVTASQFSFQGKVYVATLLPVISEKLPWTISVYAPEDDFTAVIKENRARNIYIAGAVALITAVIGLVLADYIHRPLRHFAAQSSRISAGDMLPEGPAPRTYFELEGANTALREQILARRGVESEYGQTFELAPRAMAQISPGEAAVIRANARFAELLGATSPLAVLGHQIGDVAHPEDLPAYRAAVASDGLPEGQTNHEMRWLRKDGRVIHVSMNAIVIRDATGLPRHSVLMVDDITAHKEREAEIARLNRDLSHLARGHTMGEMASGLAHELNQPLTAIAQNADTARLVLEQQRNADPELQELIGDIEREALRAGEIIRALRSFIRKDKSCSTGFDLANLADQTLRLVQAEATEAGVRISNLLPADLPAVLGNRTQIAQVLVNLLRNAIEALSAAPSAERMVSLSARRDGTMLRVSVEDNGPGISETISLFSQFETTKADGMGLGLSICRSLIQANQGELWHEGTGISGARFSFTLRLDPGGLERAEGIQGLAAASALATIDDTQNGTENV